MCDLTMMQNNEKAWVWSACDFSDGEAQTEQFAARFQNVDAAKQFKSTFEAAKTFNSKAKEGAKDDELTWAETVEDLDEPVVDDIDTNKTADADGEAE